MTRLSPRRMSLLVSGFVVAVKWQHVQYVLWSSQDPWTVEWTTVELPLKDAHPDHPLLWTKRASSREWLVRSFPNAVTLFCVPVALGIPCPLRARRLRMPSSHPGTNLSKQPHLAILRSLNYHERCVERCSSYSLETTRGS